MPTASTVPLFLCLLFFSSFSLATSLDSFYLNDCGQSEIVLPDYQTNPENLSDAEQIAIYNYTASSYRSLNPLLADGASLNSCQETEVSLIDSALDKIPNYSGIVYRGTSRRTFPAEVGQRVLLRPYVSTSPSKDSAEPFIRDRLLVLRVKTGKLITAYSNAPWEDEVLLPRNTAIRILTVTEEEFELLDEAVGEFKKHMIEVVFAEQI